MLKDKDAQVVANCLTSLQEIWGLEANTSKEAAREREAIHRKPVVYYFLNRIKEFSERAQCIVFELVAEYVPTDSEEIFDIMNLLEDRLQHANGAVALATIKVFLHITLSMTDVHQQMLREPKSKAALIWMLGEYAQNTQDAPYILESLIDNWDEEHSSEATINEH